MRAPDVMAMAFLLVLLIVSPCIASASGNYRGKSSEAGALILNKQILTSTDDSSSSLSSSLSSPSTSTSSDSKLSDSASVPKLSNTASKLSSSASKLSSSSSSVASKLSSASKASSASKLPSSSSKSSFSSSLASKLPSSASKASFSSSSASKLASLSSSASKASHVSTSTSSIISSDSVLVALLDSPYTELAEMADEASLLQTLEQMVGSNSITVLAPRNSFLDRNLDPDFRRFLLEPGNIDSLRELLRFHVIPVKIPASQWRNATYQTLAAESVDFAFVNGKMKVDLSNVLAPNAIVRRDGIVHGIDRLLIPKTVQNAYNMWKEGTGMGRILAVLPEGSPTPETFRAQKAAAAQKAALKARAYAPPTMSIFEPGALAPGPSLAPAPAPGPGSGKKHFDGESVINDFISTLVRYGGYSEMADLLVNLTSLAPELAKLVSEGYRMTILAPNDEAMAELTAEDLAAPGAPEQIIFYHIIPEYQTEESFYNAVRKFGKVSYLTLREPHKLVAQEEDGTVVFGETSDKAHLIDIDIFKDGRISVQGVDKVMSPSEVSTSSKKGRKLGEDGGELDEEVIDEGETKLEPVTGNRMAHGWLCQVLGRLCE